jgi:hypothetical protein
MLDLRVPSGVFFALTGAILMVHSMILPGLRAPMTDANVNLYSGVVMLGFGALLLALAARGRRA